MSGFMDSGDMAFEFTSCYFCFYISPTYVFFFHFHFLKLKKKSVMVENKD